MRKDAKKDEKKVGIIGERLENVKKKKKKETESSKSKELKFFQLCIAYIYLIC